MRIIVVYDIPNNRIRGKVSDICEDYGLDRVQYSAFSGDLARVYQEELMEKVTKRLGKQPGKIYLYPICQKDWQQRIEIERAKKEEGEIEVDGRR
jgi:CRISPR-associated protein Cas2